MNAHTPFDANQDWTNPYCQNSSNDPMVDALLGNAYHVVRTVYCNLGNLKLIYDFLNQYGMVLGVQSEAELKALTTKAKYARIYGFSRAGDRQVTDYLYVEGDHTGILPNDTTATGSWITVATSGSNGGSTSSGEGAYIPWVYANGSAAGGETTINVPDNTVGVPFIIINGDMQYVGRGFDFNVDNLSVTLAQPLEEGDEVVFLLTGVPALPDNPNVNDWVQINWLYNNGAAVGGEQIIAIPYTFQSIPAVYKNGLRLYKGLTTESYTADPDNQRILLTEPLATNDRLIVQIGGEARVLEAPDHTLQEVARATNVKDSEVILSTDTTQFLNNKKVIYSVSEQKSYGLPVLPTNVYIQSVSNGQLTYAPGNITVDLLPVPNSSENLALTTGASFINSSAGISVQDYLNTDFELYRKVLAHEGYNLVNGSFKQGATVNKKRDAVWNQADGKFYTYVGSGAFPITLSANASLTADWAEATLYTSFIVGNDANTAYYDFAQLSDALGHISSLQGRNSMNDQSTFRIVIPAGRHTFNAIKLRGVDLSNVQIWGAGSASSTPTIINCVPSNTTDGIWWSMRFAQFADMSGIRFEWDAGVTSPTDPAIACQRWYGSGSAPWLPAQTVNFIDMLSSNFGRMSDLLFIGDNSGAGVRLGACLNVACSNIQQLDSIEARNLRDMLVVYNGSNIGSGYGVIRGTQVFNFIVNHESTVALRLVAASAFNTTATVRTGSVFIDTFRGKTVVLAASAAGVARFDTLFLMNAGEIDCGVAAASISTYNKIQESYGDCNKLASKLTITNSDMLLSNNSLLLLNETGISDVNSTSRKYGTLTYVGNGAANNTIAIPAMVRKLTIRNRTTNMSITLIVDQILVNASGTNAAWFNSPANNLVLYTGDFNTNGVNYDVVWER
ncbi:hypothetical protein PhAPEC5_68 [Escherichia phage vB_EcoP_PhAPEC5]|uniref:Tail spike TSP1/Gp66 N-terminal domain-containing protein n=1 Tax=Escherichia phage vB_EcoP_PhAPEC5 TaxID=1395983 RepID=A0A067Y1B2_9CAUD|nr:tail protein [Escherichia phage vB_EcoP_PhAPEC5]AGV99352.1 hypothetical protein PhAPEC5_68 [Escherichia phage vB_EcoP_PhAPEC5]